MCKWGLVLASIKDLARPAELLSLEQTVAIGATGWCSSKFSLKKKVHKINFQVTFILVSLWSLFQKTTHFYQSICLLQLHKPYSYFVYWIISIKKANYFHQEGTRKRNEKCVHNLSCFKCNLNLWRKEENKNNFYEIYFESFRGKKFHF